MPILCQGERKMLACRDRDTGDFVECRDGSGRGDGEIGIDSQLSVFARPPRIYSTAFGKRKHMIKACTDLSEFDAAIDCYGSRGRLRCSVSERTGGIVAPSKELSSIVQRNHKATADADRRRDCVKGGDRNISRSDGSDKKDSG